LVENIRFNPETGLSLLNLGDMAFTLKDQPPNKRGATKAIKVINNKSWICHNRHTYHEKIHANHNNQNNKPANYKWVFPSNTPVAFIDGL